MAPLRHYDVPPLTPTTFIIEYSFRVLSWWSGLFSSRRWSLSLIVSPTDLDPYYFEVISSIQSLPRFGTFSRPTLKPCFTPKCLVNYYALMHFEENQLALGSSGISPLTTTHLLILQHSLMTMWEDSNLASNFGSDEE